MYFAVLGYYFAKNSAPVYVTRLLFGVVKHELDTGINLVISPTVTYDGYLHKLPFLRSWIALGMEK